MHVICNNLKGVLERFRDLLYVNSVTVIIPFCIIYHGFKTYDFSMKARKRIAALDDAIDLRLVKLRIQHK